MMNNPLVVREALAFAARVQRDTGSDPAAQFQLAWRIAFGRPPSSREIRTGVKFLNEQADAARAAPAKPKAGTPSPALAALAHLCQALLSSNEFLYVD
jgi:hypothetical protein